MPHEPTGPGQAGSFPGASPGSLEPSRSFAPPAALPRTTPPGEAPFGASLEPVLREACAGRLSQVSWFRTDWQRGGALTGYAVYRDDAGVERPAVVKLPVPPRELQWLIHLQQHGGLVPVLYAHGQALGGYDMVWVVMERLPCGPLGPLWKGREFDLLVAASGRFYAAAEALAVHEPPPAKDWEAILRTARESLARHSVSEEQRWKNALKKAQQHLPQWLEVWDRRPVNQWCHGDLHLANGLTREAPPEGPAVLIDFAQVHAGCWVEDAVYFEHLFWARRQRLEGRKLCSLMAQERRKHGLPVEPDWAALAQVRRALVAMSTPAMLHVDGDPQHVRAALEVLEREVGG